MKEELISFETAKLAKEKGFNIDVLHFYNTDKTPRICKGLEYMSGCYTKSDWNNGFGSYPTLAEEVSCSAPTQSLLQKWLREIHNITFSIYPNQDKKWTCNITTIKNHNLIGTTYGKTYEEALEFGLFKALKLIK